MLALGSVRFLQEAGMVQQHSDVLELALAATQRLGDREAEAQALIALGRLARGSHGNRASIELYQRADDRLPADGDPLVRAMI
jgi:hypothetical protein